MTCAVAEAFVYRADMSPDEIPADEVNPVELGVAERVRPVEYTRVLSTLYRHFSPSDRLLLCLIFARDVFGEDAPGGWNKLGSGLAVRFDLGDRYVRRRAVAALEQKGVVEVRRRRGATTLVRLKDRI